MKTTIIPRVCPGNPAGVAVALQAVSSKGTMRYVHQVKNSTKSISQADVTSQWEKTWIVPSDRDDIWRTKSRRWLNLLVVLQRLIDLSKDVKAFKRMLHWTTAFGIS